MTPGKQQTLQIQTQFCAASTTLMVSNSPYLNAPGLVMYDLRIHHRKMSSSQEKKKVLFRFKT